MITSTQHSKALSAVSPLRLTSAALALAMTIGLAPILPIAHAQNDPYWDNSQNSTYYDPAPAQQQQPYNGYAQQQQQPPQQYGAYQQQQQQYGGGYQQQPDLRGYVATAPAGTQMNVTSNVMVSSEYAQIGDMVQFPLAGDISSGGQTIIPSGSTIVGQVVHVQSAGRTGRHGELAFRFNSAQLPDGRTIPLSARMVTPDGSGTLKGGTGKNRVGNAAGRTVGGAALGAGAGALIGLISGGGRGAGRGALYGTAIGGATGAGSAVYNKGHEVVVRPGQPINIVLDQPLTVNNAPNNNYGGGGGYGGGY
ncbi:MAG: hypothetical protein KC476_04420 [Cyanobacteria bacterium HKST-UBA06]|nr:hypothetical protein [Cyanobacteria bacterium HKST-UBA06]